MKQLIIAEKPSVAIDIAKAIGQFETKDGYLENSDYVVTWCYGHLITNAMMADYDESLKAWDLDTLPFIPQKWKTKIIENSKSQFYNVKKLIERSDVSTLICGTDGGREGELIFWLIYEYIHCQKPVKRLWISSFEDSVVREGMANLLDGSEKKLLLESAKCRSQADFLVGINSTRLFTIKYGNGNVLNVGRVQSPTINMISKRDKEIISFIPKDYYIVKLILDSFEASLRLDDKSIAEQIKNSYTSLNAVVRQIETKDNVKKAPQLYDLTALQKVSNRLFGYSAQQTLDIVQKLYENKLMTYPRTDSKFVSSSQKELITSLISSLKEIQPVPLSHDYKENKINIDSVIDDSQVTDHHAILVTETGIKHDWATLSESERKIMTLVAYQMLSATYSPYMYQSTKVTIGVDCYEFEAKTQNLIDLGYRALEIKCREILKINKKEKGEILLPLLTENQELNIKDIKIESKKTTPPQHFTDETLLEAMEKCKIEDNKELSAILKSVKGIGRSSTRANIIETIIRSGFVQREKNYLIATEKAHKLMSILPPLLTSAKMTAEWEEKLDQIERGELSSQQFMNEIESFVTEVVNQEKSTVATFQFENNKPQKEEIGKCPNCQSPVHESDKNFYCSNRECSFALWKENKFFESQGKKITKTIAKSFLNKGEVLVKGLKSQKTGKEYDAIIKVDFNDKYPKFSLEFPKTNKK
ncbi:MAG: DNA topoisomerase 3 [Turicibacter sp.]